MKKVITINKVPSTFIFINTNLPSTNKVPPYPIFVKQTDGSNIETKQLVQTMFPELNLNRAPTKNRLNVLVNYCNCNNFEIKSFRWIGMLIYSLLQVYQTTLLPWNSEKCNSQFYKKTKINTFKKTMHVPQINCARVSDACVHFWTDHME